MEIACGQYGDVVPKLVVTAQNDGCVKFQNASMSEVKPNNCDKSVKDYGVMDPKCLLQDGVIVDNMLTPTCNGPLSAQKVERDVSTEEANDLCSSPWKTVNISSSDDTIASAKAVSSFIVRLVNTVLQECTNHGPGGKEWQSTTGFMTRISSELNIRNRVCMGLLFPKRKFPGHQISWVSE